MTSSGSTASSGGAAAAAGGASERTIQVRDGRKYSVGEVSTFNHNNTTVRPHCSPNSSDWLTLIASLTADREGDVEHTVSALIGFPD